MFRSFDYGVRRLLLQNKVKLLTMVMARQALHIKDSMALVEIVILSLVFVDDSGIILTPEVIYSLCERLR